MRFLVRILVSAGVIFGVAYLSNGRLLDVNSFWPDAVLAAIVLALVNALVKPIVHLVSLPVTILTLGLFALVINALMLMLVAWVSPGVDTVGFFPTVLAAAIISIVTSVLTKWTENEDR